MLWTRDQNLNLSCPTLTAAASLSYNTTFSPQVLISVLAFIEIFSPFRVIIIIPDRQLYSSSKCCWSKETF